jgi:RecA/RadA recombinase
MSNATPASPRPAGGQAPGPASALAERVRCAAERPFAEVLLARVEVAALLRDNPLPDPDSTRRRLLVAASRLTEGVAPEAWAAARRAAEQLGVSAALEIHQTVGAEDASVHLVPDPALIELRTGLLGQLDDGALTALFGHELGHFVAHGPGSPGIDAAHAASLVLARRGRGESVRAAANLLMAREITADRFALLASGGLEPAMRLSMSMTTGLPSSALTRDVAGYLAQCHELVAELERQGSTFAISHPERSVRSWAASEFVRTGLFAELTGRRGGELSVAELDARIVRLLSASPVVMSEAAALPSPDRDLHEAALACSVYVAASDGEVHDDERAAIEATYASVLPEWSALLNLDVALERLECIAPVIRGASTDERVALLSLIAHVMAADGNVTADEIEYALSIGDFIGCRPQFERLLPRLLEAMGIAPAPGKPQVRQAPLPPRAGETRVAIDAHLAGIASRGAGSTTLRRLTRLAGLTELPEARDERRLALAAVARAIEAAGLLCDVDPLDAPLDELLTLRRPEPVAPATVTRVQHDPARTQLRRAVAKLRERLISGDGRSPSVRLRRTGSSSFDLHDLESLSAGLSERVLSLVREGHEATVVSSSEVGIHEVAERATSQLRQVWRENRTRLEETGACDLYVGYPFVSGSAGGYVVRGPLVLYPTDLVVEDRGARTWRLRWRTDEVPVVNQVLLRLLFSKKGFALPDALIEKLDELAAVSPEAVAAELARLGLDTQQLSGALRSFDDLPASGDAAAVDRLAFEECAVLGLFPQSGSDQLQDYDGLLDALDDPSRDPADLLGAAGLLLPAALREALGVDTSEQTAPDDIEPVVYADPSQLAVLRRAHEVRALVVDGPPGTGKSQVIVNLVADAIARGQRVAVVCEKRAALDVVANRLDAVGLRHLLAVVHDVGLDRKALLAQLASRLESATDRTFDPAAFDRLCEDRARLVADLSSRLEALAWRTAPSEPTAGELHAGGAGLGGPTLPPAPQLAALAPEAVDELARALARLHPHAELLGEHPQLALHLKPERRSFATDTHNDLANFATASESAAIVAERASQAIAASELGVDTLLGLRDVVSGLLGLREVIDGEGGDTMQRLLEAQADDNRLRRIDDAVADWADAGPALERQPGPVTGDTTQALDAALPVVSSLGGAWYRWFMPAWWRARGVVQGWIAAHWPESAARPLTEALVADVRGRLRAARAWTGLFGAVSSVGVDLERPRTRDDADRWARAAARATRQYRALRAARPALEAARLWPDGSTPLRSWMRRIEKVAEAIGAIDAWEQAARPVSEALPALGPRPDASGLRDLGVQIRDEGLVWVEADRLVAAARALHPSAGSLAAELTRTARTAAAAQWADAVRAAWVRARLAAAERSCPDLKRIDAMTPAGTLPEAEARLAELSRQIATDSAWRAIVLADGVGLAAVPDAEPRRRRTAPQAAREAMLKEARKQRNLLPLRTFVRTWAQRGLLDTLPVWLLSPETMSVLFTHEAMFDLIVIDEASQCTVAAGFPVLLRGRRVVIAGDERQMPPTSFFESAAVEADEIAEEDSEAVETLDGESLLVLARERVPHTGLSWHYRCLFEELIAFSNHAMYGGSLQTIPATASLAAPPQLAWVHVDDARYDAGVNVVEAGCVVSLLHDTLRGEKPPTVGVVTFNLQQRRAILDAIDARLEQDPAFAERWRRAESSERVDERPFVKNLESVQGDERDVIIFSLGHAPTTRRKRDGSEERYVPARFGPLGLKGGERRLNVAVSRAKRRIVVVSSFEPSMLSVSQAVNSGPRLFKSFLEFAWHLSAGRRSQADRALDLVREETTQASRPAGARRRHGFLVPLRMQVALALQERGHRVDTDIGSSGFKVPVAVVDPRSPDRFALGILCDEGTGVGSAFGRHVHVPHVLSVRGWRVVSVNAREWDRDRAGVLRRLEAAIAEA